MEPLSGNARVYVRGLSEKVTEDALREHFTKYGRVVKATVAKEGPSGRTKEFGFVWFADEDSAKAAVGDVEEHLILGTKVEVRESIGREQSLIRRDNQGISCLNCENIRNRRNGFSHVKKIFVGGLPSDLTEVEFKSFFETFGETTDVVIIVEPESRRSRGFGFVTFASEESAREVLRNSRYLIRDKDVEVKVAIPKEEANATERPNGLSQGHYYPSAGMNMNMYCDFTNHWPRYGKMEGQPYTYSAPLYPPTLQPPPPYSNSVFGHWITLATQSPAYAYMLPPSPAYYANGMVNGFHGYNGFATTLSSGHRVTPRLDLGASRKFTRIKITKPPGMDGERGGSSPALRTDGPSPASMDCNNNDHLSPAGTKDGKVNASASRNGQNGGLCSCSGQDQQNVVRKF